MIFSFGSCKDSVLKCPFILRYNKPLTNMLQYKEPRVCSFTQLLCTSAGGWFTIGYHSDDRHTGHRIPTWAAPEGKPQSVLAQPTIEWSLWSWRWLKSNFWPLILPVCAGCCGHRQPKGHADAVQRRPVLVAEGQARLCRDSLSYSQRSF